MKYLFLFFLLFSTNAFAAFDKQCKEIIQLKGKISEDKRFKKLLNDHWAYITKEFPEFGTYLGLSGMNDRWSDHSLATIERHQNEDKCLLKALETFDRNVLSKNQWLNYDMYLTDLKKNVERFAFNDEFLSINQLSGFHQEIAQTLGIMSQQKLTDYKDRLARLNLVPTLIDQNIELLKIGLKKKITPPQITMKGVPQQIRNLLKDVDENALYSSFEEMPKSFPAADREKIQAEAKKIITEKVFPSLKKLLEFLEGTYIPGCRTEIAWSSLPNGKDWYNFLIRLHTTTTLTADQIHEIGIKEVDRIKGEMEKIKSEVKFKGTLVEFFNYLKTDSKFGYNSKEELLAGYRDISKRIDPELTRLFGKLPRTPYGVLPVPTYSEKEQAAAYYIPGSLESGRPGYFMANTYDVKSRYKWEMEALTLHEAVPGHHLQIALAQEMTNVPEFRKNTQYTAYIEGWGLYAESLGEDLGMYKDPYSRFGQLSYEMWRAIRLVVDTGMHAKGWSREKAIQFFESNVGKSNQDIIAEVDRYIVWAGQALAYKIGQLKIKELKDFSRASLGEQFDVRKFHDQVLDSGSLPLTILDTKIKNWVSSEKKKFKNIKR